METSGGLMGVGSGATETPQFTLYGDGTVVFRPVTDMLLPDRPGLPRLVVGRLDEEALQALLAHALGPGRLLNAREHYPQTGCADVPNSVFTIVAAGMAKTVTVEAAGMAECAGADSVDRAGFAILAETLGGFEERARRGELGEATLYDPSHYRVFLLEGFGEPVEVADWPWPELTADDFTTEGDDWRRRVILDREQVAALTDVPNAGQSLIYVTDTAGRLWEVAVRPLLPDELAAEGLD